MKWKLRNKSLNRHWITGFHNSQPFTQSFLVVLCNHKVELVTTSFHFWAVFDTVGPLLSTWSQNGLSMSSVDASFDGCFFSHQFFMLVFFVKGFRI